MSVYYENVMVVGIAKSGISVIRYFENKASKIFAYDYNESVEEKYNLDDFNNVEFNIGKNPTGDENVDIVIVSPGIPFHLDFIKKFISRNIEVICDIELAYRVLNGKFIGITGTNGKTTTTTLVGEIFKNAGIDTRVVGNIGNPIIDEKNTTEDTVFITEISSFQLESSKELHFDIATIINITPDHLDRHKTIEEYSRIKSKVFNNQSDKDYCIVNLDDKLSLDIAKTINSKKIYVTTSNTFDKSLEKVVFIEDETIKLYENNNIINLIDTKEIFLKGKHNYENVVIAFSIAYSFGIDISIILDTIKNFRGVSHRLELISNINGVDYINDSKGTNPDASIKAIEAIDDNILLIVGGKDKKSDFTEFIKSFNDKVKFVAILGETKDIIANKLDELEFRNYKKVLDMQEAVLECKNNSKSGDTILLSPACASLDMYSSYEERGDHFRKIVGDII